MPLILNIAAKTKIDDAASKFQSFLPFRNLIMKKQPKTIKNKNKKIDCSLILKERERAILKAGGLLNYIK